MIEKWKVGVKRKMFAQRNLQKATVTESDTGKVEYRKKEQGHRFRERSSFVSYLSV